VAWCRKIAPVVTDPSKVRLALFQPDIPQNLGANIRLAACLGVALDIVEPCGFPLTDRAMRRTALDYGQKVRITRHSGWRAFCDSPELAGRRIVLLTTRAETPLQAFSFRTDDCLLLGRESAGVPDDVHNAVTVRLRIPMAPAARSLNVAMAAGMALFEALRQTDQLPLISPD
jgi:tRNA (cytidine/uridine-2'-O-)-methyltransferase